MRLDEWAMQARLWAYTNGNFYARHEEEQGDHPGCKALCGAFGAILTSVAILPPLALSRDWSLGGLDPFDVGLRATVAATAAFLPVMVWFHWTRCLTGSKAQGLFVAALRRIPLMPVLMPALAGGVTLLVVMLQSPEPEAQAGLGAVSAMVTLGVVACAMALRWSERRRPRLSDPPVDDTPKISYNSGVCSRGSPRFPERTASSSSAPEAPGKPRCSGRRSTTSGVSGSTFSTQGQRIGS